MVEVHPNLKLLSNSSVVLAHKCPRKFELYRMTKPNKDPDQSDVDLDFGSWVGIGIQEYLITNSLDQSYFKMLCSNTGDLFSEDGERSKKTFWHAMIAVEKFAEFRHTALRDYKLVELHDGKHAVEVGFVLDCIDGFSYRGFLDALLINMVTGELTCLECKTTKFTTIHEAVYKNSGQGLGYSLVTDAIKEFMSSRGSNVGSAWNVIYPVYKAGALDWEFFHFKKNNAQRITWLRNLLRDIQHISEYAADEHFPMHGENCFDFFRPCEYFEMCEMDNKYLIGDLDKVPVKVENEDKYSFKFSLIEVITSQQNRLEAGS